MTDKQILDRLDSINLSLKQKKDLLDVIKDIVGNNDSNNHGFNDNDFIIVKHVENTENGNFNIYINNKLCDLHHYDHYSNNEHKIIDAEIFDLFNTFKRILIYIDINDIFKTKSTIGYRFDYININSTEQFILTYNTIDEDNTVMLHINKE